VNAYSAEVLEEIERGPGIWKGIRVGVFRVTGGRRELVGEYRRNYPNLLDTFFAFAAKGQELALYSPHYTATRVLRLPDCVDIGGEEPAGGGFCPGEFFVPTYADMEWRHQVTIATQRTFDLREGRVINPRG
jgi:hypothetical protein